MSKTYLVQIPIAGHITFEVEADDEAEAKAKAFDSDPSKGELEWELLESFNEGNVCSCPQPWEVDIAEC